MTKPNLFADFFYKHCAAAKIVPITLLLFSLELTACISSARQEALEAKYTALEKRLQQAEEVQKGFSGYKNTTDDVNKRSQAFRGEIEDLKRQLALTRGSQDEILMKIERLKEVQDESSKQLGNIETQTLSPREKKSSLNPGVLEEIGALERQLAALASVLEPLEASLLREQAKEGVKSKQKKKTANDISKELGLPFAEKDFKKVIKLATGLLNSGLSPDAAEAALEFRAESFFLLKMYPNAGRDFIALVVGFPNYERRARALLLAGDSLAFQKRYLVAAAFYKECSRDYGTKEEGKQAQNRFTNLSAKLDL